MAYTKKPSKKVIPIDSTHKVKIEHVEQQIITLRSRLKSKPSLQILIDKWLLRLEKLNKDEDRVLLMKQRDILRKEKLANSIKTYKNE